MTLGGVGPMKDNIGLERQWIAMVLTLRGVMEGCNGFERQYITKVVDDAAMDSGNKTETTTTLRPT